MEGQKIPMEEQYFNRPGTERYYIADVVPPSSPPGIKDESMSCLSRSEHRKRRDKRKLKGVTRSRYACVESFNETDNTTKTIVFRCVNLRYLTAKFIEDEIGDETCFRQLEKKCFIASAKDRTSN